MLLFVVFRYCTIFFGLHFVFLSNFFMLACSFGNDVYAVSEVVFEDLCIICWNLWQFYVSKVDLHSYDVIKCYVY